MSTHDHNSGMNFDGHDHHDHEGHHDGSMADYVKGFIYSVILTAIPFILVMTKAFESNKTTVFVILAFAFVQVFVHMKYFLHMNAKSEGGWNMLALIFTAILVIIMFSGSVWVMYHLDNNMMPMSTQNAHDMV